MKRIREFLFAKLVKPYIKVEEYIKVDSFLRGFDIFIYGVYVGKIEISKELQVKMS